MKVRELIQALGELDPNLEVLMPSTVADHGGIESVTLDLASRSHGDLQLCYDDDDGAIQVVRLVGVGEWHDTPTNPYADDPEESR